MTVTETASSDHQLVDGVVIFLQDVEASVQQVVSQSVELGEVDAQVGDTQKLCKGEKEISVALFCIFQTQLRKIKDYTD